MKKNVLITGPILTYSGYGEHARFVWRALKSRPDLFDVYVKPIKWGESSWMWHYGGERDEIDADIAKTAQAIQTKTLRIDTNIMVTICNELKVYHVPNCTNIAVTAGVETDKVPPEWLAQINQFCDKVIVPSEFSKEGIVNSTYNARNQYQQEFLLRCEKDVEVVNYPVRQIEPKDLKLDLDTDFNFLAVAQWGPRKNIDQTVRMFLDEFKDNPEVGLVLKTQKVRNSTMDRHFVEKSLKELKSEFPDAKCKIYLLHGFLTAEEMHGLYRDEKINAIVNFGHGEGYGLPLFEAAYSGLPVITHDFGGQKDFLYAAKGKEKKLRPHYTKVPYKLGNVPHEAASKDVITPDMLWAYPSEQACKFAMRDCYKNYGLCSGKAKRLRGWLEKEFEEGKRYNKFVEAVWGEKVFDYNSIDVADLPKISIITSVYDGDEFIESFLEDITRQTIFEEKCELIMINANSPGNEEEVILKYQEKYPNNIVYKKLDDDPGIYGVWNRAIEISTGEFLTNANLDDRKAANSIEAHAKNLFSNEDIDLVYADSFITNNPNETFEENSSQGRRYNFEKFSKEAMLRGNLPHNNPMWRKTLHDKNGLFESKYKSAGDWEFWLRCACAGSKYKKLDQPMGLYYFNPKGLSTNFENFESKQEEEQEIYQKYKKLAVNE